MCVGASDEVCDRDVGVTEGRRPAERLRGTTAADATQEGGERHRRFAVLANRGGRHLAQGSCGPVEGERAMQQPAAAQRAHAKAEKDGQIQIE